MDILKNITDSEDRDIIVSLPNNKSWLDYLSSFMGLKIDDQKFNIIIRTVPKTSSGKKCYIIFEGFLRGWMEIYRLKETVDNEICIELIPNLNLSAHKIPMHEIEDFKYFLDNSNMQ